MDNQQRVTEIRKIYREVRLTSNDCELTSNDSQQKTWSYRASYMEHEGEARFAAGHWLVQK